MDNFKNTPASMRYLGARLKPFRRPMFWGSIGLACVVGLALYEYWRHPDWINGNLSELQTSNNDSASRLSNLANQGQISAEDLAVGADLDNLDLLLKELEQNQTIPFTETVKKNKSANSLQFENKDTTYHRFQEQQKSKLTRSPDPLIPQQSSTKSLVKSPTRAMFELPVSKSFNPTILPAPPEQNSTSPNSELIPNPVGRLYLSTPNRLNSAITPTAPLSSINTGSPLEPIPATTDNLTQNNSNFPTATTGVNLGTTNTFITPSVVPYTNNINLPTTTPTSAYGQPIYPQQQPANVDINPGLIGSQTANVLPRRFQSNNLSNQQQTQRYYQLTPSNYQLTPQVSNQRNVNTGFNSQPSAFSSNGSFENSPFNNN